VTFSSDLVFDGSLGRPYVESDEPRPANVYGLSKAEAERHVLALHPNALTIRTSAFFGPWDRYNFAWNVLNALARGEPVEASPDAIVSPTYVPDLVHAALDLLVDGERGVWHLANDGAMSWHAFAQRLAEEAGLDPALVLPMSDGNSSNTALGSERGMMLRSLDEAIGDYVREVADLIEPMPEMSVAAE
jgi:dTDP-4-dehydrorhamnose reductase